MISELSIGVQFIYLRYSNSYVCLFYAKESHERFCNHHFQACECLKSKIPPSFYGSAVLQHMQSIHNLSDI
jgi:hypothetical protein